jgi:hypothetical protein
MKALELLKKNKTVLERAERFAATTKRNIQRDVIDALVATKEKIEDSIFELSNFVLDTNLNAGLKTMTQEECEARFKKLIEAEFELTLIDVELKTKKEAFEKYFGEEK